MFYITSLVLYFFPPFRHTLDTFFQMNTYRFTYYTLSILKVGVHDHMKVDVEQWITKGSIIFPSRTHRCQILKSGHKSLTTGHEVCHYLTFHILHMQLLKEWNSDSSRMPKNTAYRVLFPNELNACMFFASNKYIHFLFTA